MAIVGSGIILIYVFSAEDNLKIILGIVYAIMNLCGSFSSKKAYLLRNKKSAKECLFFFHILFLIIFGLLAIFTKQFILVCIIYIFVYMVHSMRKPIFADEIDNQIGKSTRATFLSLSAQLKSIFLMVIAPVLGFVADTVGIGYVMAILCAVFSMFAFYFKNN